ncbi:MAG: UDP-N-acetylmuramoyl-L-alanyl-D-glutamate--2,6-diaminopimelate ligase [Terriglobales bacterium]|jgi:UDP-N-acetylmuramoyl-L-alanyl-D-glutamate--2,6-diaminopimelate ligase
MTFQQLLDGAEILSQSGSSTGNPAITGVDYDSRRVRPGFIFVAMKGETSDGNRFIDQAIAAGAVAIVSDSTTETPRPGVAWAQVPHGRRALARLSANFYKHPAERIANTGITGTNGKSTTAFIIESILQAGGRKTALVGTIEYHVAGKVLPAPHTTPEALELNQLLAEGLAQGVTESVMEVSSHALAQERIFGIPFDVAVFTNLTRDHLDYHGTMDEYFHAKKILFEGCGTEPPRAAVLNIDDEYGRQLLTLAKKKSSVVFTYGMSAGDFHAESVEITPRGTRFEMTTPAEKISIWSPLIGKVNVYNVLAAAAAGYARLASADRSVRAAQAADAIARGVSNLTRVPGRFERVDCGQPFTVVVDYAHTDDALRNLTMLARDFVAHSSSGATGAAARPALNAAGKVITLFGCGGDRDRSKRPLMGEAAGNGSDFVVLTSDNPRSEDPLAIINDAVVGLQRSGLQKSGARYATEPDRRKAIALAIGKAAPGDIVLLAGKGHEKTQTTREGSVPFDDVVVAREVLASLGYECDPAHASPAGSRA